MPKKSPKKKSTRILGYPTDATLAKYGLDREDYDALFERGSCAICHQRFCEEAIPVIDHRHGGDVRELLCNRCNVLLGMALDQPTILFMAANYLEKHHPSIQGIQYPGESPVGSPYRLRGYTSKHGDYDSGDYLNIYRHGVLVAEIGVHVLPALNAHASIDIRRYKPRELRKVMVMDDFDGEGEEDEDLNC